MLQQSCSLSMALQVLPVIGSFSNSLSALDVHGGCIEQVQKQEESSLPKKQWNALL
jgi:hypothetical protein